jgi:hypothetical protein
LRLYVERVRKRGTGCAALFRAPVSNDLYRSGGGGRGSCGGASQACAGGRQYINSCYFRNGIDGGGVAIRVSNGGSRIERAAGRGTAFLTAITESDSYTDVRLSVIWVCGLNLDGNGQSGPNSSILGATASDVDDVKQSVGFEACLRGYIDFAVDDGLCDEMADRWELVASVRSLVRGVEQLKRSGVKGQEFRATDMIPVCGLLPLAEIEGE